MIKLSLQQFPLPSHQFRRVLVPVGGEFAEGGAAGDEGGINAQFVRVMVPALFQVVEALHFGFGRAIEFVP